MEASPQRFSHHAPEADPYRGPSADMGYGRAPPMQAPQCGLPGCPNPVFVEDSGQVHNYCCQTHESQHQDELRYARSSGGYDARPDPYSGGRSSYEPPMSHHAPPPPPPPQQPYSPSGAHTSVRVKQPPGGASSFRLGW